MRRRIFSDNRNLRIATRSFSVVICAATAAYHIYLYQGPARDFRTLIALVDSVVFGVFFLADAALLIVSHPRRREIIRGAFYFNFGVLVLILCMIDQYLGLYPDPLLLGVFYPLGALILLAGIRGFIRVSDRPDPWWQRAWTRLRQWHGRLR